MKPQVSWEEEAIYMVGEVISFWGFKENHGKIWALLYLKEQQLSTSSIRHQLLLSKGATSMLLQDLENWGIIHRVDQDKERERHYRANDNFLEMISNILQHREAGIVSKALNKLQQIEVKAQQNHATTQEIKRLQHMQEFAQLMKQLLLLGTIINKGSIQQISSRIDKLSKVLL